MGIYVSKNGIVTQARLSPVSHPAYAGEQLPILGLVRGEDGRPVKFFDFLSDLDYLEARVDTVFLNGQAVPVSALSGHGSVSVDTARKTISATSTAEGAAIGLCASLYAHMKTTDTPIRLTRAFGADCGPMLRFAFAAQMTIYANGYGGAIDGNLLDKSAWAGRGSVPSGSTARVTVSTDEPTTEGICHFLLAVWATNGSGRYIQSIAQLTSAELNGQSVELVFTDALE